MRNGKARQYPASCLQLLLCCMQHCRGCTLPASGRGCSLQGSECITAECLYHLCQLLVKVTGLIPQCSKLLHRACCCQPLHHAIWAVPQLLQALKKVQHECFPGRLHGPLHCSQELAHGRGPIVLQTTLPMLC